MKIILVKDYEEMSYLGSLRIAKEILENPNAVLGLATGSSPLGIYRRLIEMYKNEILDFSKITTINLDEYVGLDQQHQQSYRWFMNNYLFNHINIDMNNTYLPNGMAKDLEEEGIKYDQQIEQLGGIDLQLLGIGTNGHIAFNEPAPELLVGTHVAKLSKSTIEANSRFFNNIEEVPTTALTMGLGQIMRAKQVLLIASGEQKAEALGGLLSGKITTENPATMLQLHRDATVIADEEAYKLVKRRG